MFKLYFLVFSVLFGLFSVANAYHGLAMVVRGEVNRESQGKNEEIKVGARIFQGDKITVGKDSFVKIVMTDRNIINIYADSTLTINHYENEKKLQLKNVELFLDNGKVRSDVNEKYDGEKNKFIIKTPNTIAGVRGTILVVSYDSSTTTSDIITIRGRVEVDGAKEGQRAGNPVVVKKGYTTKVDQNLIPQKPTKLPQKTLKQIEVETTIDDKITVEKKISPPKEVPTDKTDQKIENHEDVEEGIEDKDANK